MKKPKDNTTTQIDNNSMEHVLKTLEDHDKYLRLLTTQYNSVVIRNKNLNEKLINMTKIATSLVETMNEINNAMKILDDVCYKVGIEFNPINIDIDSISESIQEIVNTPNNQRSEG